MNEFILQSLDDSNHNKLNLGIYYCNELSSFFPKFNDNTLNIKKELENIQKKSQSIIDKRIEQLKFAIGKYWEVTIYSNNNLIINQYLIYPYLINYANKTYWFIKGYINDDYHTGMHDDHIEYMIHWDYKTVFKEITKQEFIDRVSSDVSQALNHRLAHENKNQSSTTSRTFWNNL